MTINGLPEPILQATEIAIDAGSRVFARGQSAENFVVVTHGCITVFARSEDGKEVVLYRVRPGELCILTTACLIGHTPYPADAITDAATRARVIPLDTFERFLGESDRRLAAFLHDRSRDEPVIAITHDRLATEIGTAREVVSRQLKLLELESLVSLSRGAITVVDRAGLAKRS